MSLFENDEYQWRETFFVLFDEANRPDGETLKAKFAQLRRGLEIENLQSDEADRIESLTIISEEDYAGMDISYVAGEEVQEQVPHLIDEMLAAAITPEERRQAEGLADCNARLDIFHFQRVAAGGGVDDEEGYLDPGGLLTVLDWLGDLVDGVVVDPQTGSVL